MEFSPRKTKDSAKLHQPDLLFSGHEAKTSTTAFSYLVDSSPIEASTPSAPTGRAQSHIRRSVGVARTFGYFHHCLPLACKLLTNCCTSRGSGPQKRDRRAAPCVHVCSEFFLQHGSWCFQQLSVHLRARAESRAAIRDITCPQLHPRIWTDANQKLWAETVAGFFVLARLIMYS